MSVTDGNLGTPDGTVELVAVNGTISTTPSGTQTVSGTVTANQGTPNSGGNQSWPVSMTAATAVVTATQSVSSNLKTQSDQGVAAALGSAWPMKITDGNNIFIPLNPTASTTINASTGAITGTTVDFGTPRSNISLMIVVGAGVSGGVIDLQVSHNGNDWVKVNSSTALAASTNQSLTATGVAFRYARAVTSTNVAGGNVTVTAMAT
jgi:hypothetical protein